MVELFNMVESWEHFEDYKHAKIELRKKDTEERIALYLKALNVIPFHWEDS